MEDENINIKMIERQREREREILSKALVACNARKIDISLRAARTLAVGFDVRRNT